MHDFLEPLLIVAAVALAYEYRRPEPLLFGRVELTPLLTLEEQIAEEWLATLRVGPLAPHTGSRVRRGAHESAHRSHSLWTRGHYSRNH